MITIKGSIKFIIEQQRRFKSHKIEKLIRKDGDWYLTIKKGA